ncbi:MAG: hypothetical protein Q9227_007940 [Pyrenula ochraceoflavens]
MAFSSKNLADRMEELRYPIRSPNEDSPYSPVRGHNSFFSAYQQPSANDNRAALQRRFTTDASKLTLGTGYNQQTTQGPRSIESVSMNEKTRQKLESLREQKRRYEEHMKLLDIEEQRLQESNSTSESLDQISRGIHSNRSSMIAGAVSEPTTPPDYSQAGFPTSLSRLQHLSMNSVTSPPGFSNRMSSASMQMTSPTSSSKLASTQGQFFKSLPGSRRNSEEEDDLPQELPFNRSGPSFLFEDEDDKHTTPNNGAGLSSPLSSNLVGDEFPTLRSDRNSGILSANSAALDLANPQSTKSPQPHRHSLQAMPPTNLKSYRLSDTFGSNTGDRSVESSAPQTPTAKSSLRHSMGIGFGAFSDQTKIDQKANLVRPVSLQSSYSTNDIPTMKTTNGAESTVNAHKSQAEQQFHNHNASLGRIPQGAMSNRQSRDFATMISPSVENKRDDSFPTNFSSTSALQASAPPFTIMPGASSNTMTPSNYSSSMYPAGIQNYNPTHLTQHPFQFGGQVQSYQNGNQYGQYSNYPSVTSSRYGRRSTISDDVRNGVISLEQMQGSIVEMAKDQNGCRLLQKIIEEGNPEQIQRIHNEVCDHVIELMTDPFGNYLMQKLFEHTNDGQRSDLVVTAAPRMVDIAVNQHGTRALQKMIDHLSRPDQVEQVILALRDHVTPLVQDLNGNHVIQKCLNRLSGDDTQFIFDAIARDCVDVGTHRHGCCVIQRCIDHSGGVQRAKLIESITTSAFALCTDPYGNYVVQYILDLCEPLFTKPLCESFMGNIAALSKQKFSSNVVEKAIRTADADTRRCMIEEMMSGSSMEAMVRDAYANYVVQTALEYADMESKDRMVDVIRPILPSLKNTPHGRRISSKIMAVDNLGRSGPISTAIAAGPGMPNEIPSPDIFPSPRNANPNSNRRQFGIYGNNIFQNNNSARYAGNGYPESSGFENSFSSMNLGNQGLRPGAFPNGGNSMFGAMAQPPNQLPPPNFPSFNEAQGPSYF